MIIKALALDSSYERLVKIILICLVGLASLYVYFVASIVMNAAGREQTLNQISDLSSRVSGLESTYVDLSSQVTLALATNRGFIEAANQTSFALANSQLATNNN